MEKKRSCERTSYEVRKRWNEKNLRTVTYHLPIQLVEDFKEKCLETGTPQSQIIREAMERFLEEE